MRYALFAVLLAIAFLRVSQWRKRLDRDWALCARLSRTSKEVSFPKITGSLAQGAEGRWEILDPLVSAGEGTFAFGGRVFVEGAALGRLRDSGRKLSVSGPFRCRAPLRNPGRVADGLFRLEAPTLSARGKELRIVAESQDASPAARFARAFSRWLDAPFTSAPGLRGLTRAVWLGDLSGLPERLATFYREGGLLHVLALSGQHVAVLGLVLLSALRLILRPLLWLGLWRYVAAPYRHLQRALPFLCALLLYIASHGAPSMRRTLAMAAALFLLRMRKLETSRLQLAASSVACAVVLEPGSIASPGFFLSATATAFLLRLVDEGELARGVREYLYLSLAMSLLTFPLSAFFFAKLALFGPIASLALGGVWSACLLPLGFLLPFAARVFPATVLSLEAVWRGFVARHETFLPWIQAGYRTVWRPTWGELVVWELLLLCIVLWLRKKLLRPLLFRR